MSLKNDKNISFDNNKFRTPSSIVKRLTFGYAIISALILFCIAFFLYFALVNNIQKKDLRFLVDKILHLRNILKDDHLSHHVLEQEVNEGGGYQFHKLFVRISDINGSLIFVTKGGSSLIAKLPFPSPHDVDEDPWQYKKYQTSNGKALLMMSAWAKSPTHPEKKVMLNTAIDITEEQNLLNDYRYLLFYIICGGIVVSLILAIITARHGLRPLKYISLSVQQVSVSQLHKRLDPRQWPIELAPLVLNFDKMLDRLEESVKRISRFSSDLAHELRTPIQTLRGEAEVVLSGNKTLEQLKDCTKSSLEEYDKLTHMIEGLLFISRAENIELELDKQELELSKEVHKIVEFYEALIAEKSITVHVKGACKLYADPVLLQRAITNLLSNAIKYNQQGGQIKINIREKSDSTVIVTVNNKGQTIDQNEIKYIFDRFYRSQRAKAIDHDGLGLGLSIVKSIMDLHGGTIQTQSNSSTGTTFTLIFPPKQLNP